MLRPTGLVATKSFTARCFVGGYGSDSRRDTGEIWGEKGYHPLICTDTDEFRSRESQLLSVTDFCVFPSYFLRGVFKRGDFVHWFTISNDFGIEKTTQFAVVQCS